MEKEHIGNLEDPRLSGIEVEGLWSGLWKE